MDIDPLLPPPEETGWITPPPPGVDLLAHLTIGVTDYFNFNQMVWPARDASGQLVNPPATHMLDSLARSHALVSEDEANVRPAAGTVAIIDALPSCDLCGNAQARYDAKLVSPKTGYGYYCEACYLEWGSGSLGASGDVRLMTYAEVPGDVRAVCDMITTRQGRPSLWK